MHNKALARVLAAAIAASVSAGTAAMPAMMTAIEVMAADETLTQTTPATQTISVSNVEGNAVVTAYQLVTGNYNAVGQFVRYSLTDLAQNVTVEGKEVTLEDLVDAAAVTTKDPDTGTESTTVVPDNTSRLSAWAGAIANKAQGASGITMKNTAGEGAQSPNKTYTYAANVQPGLYLVLVTGTDSAVVYNPVLLAVNVTNADLTPDESGAYSVTGSSVDMNSAFENGTTSAYMKRSASEFDKNIVDVTEGNADGTTTSKDKARGDAVAIGDTVTFRLDNMTIPAYSADYESVQYTIKDTLEATGFGSITNLTVYVGGTAAENQVAASDTTYTLTGGNGSKAFEIAFTDSYIRAHGNTQVVITYQSTLASTAGLNYAENYNHATLAYSNSPTDAISVKTITRNTYHYTFGIDANIDGEAGADGQPDGWETHEINKVTTANGESAFVETTTTYSGTGAASTSKDSTALAGAEFTLYTDADCKVKAQALQGSSMGDATAVSDANGHITFLGLDEGVYYLKETRAPQDYTMSSKVYRIVIDGTFDETTGIMQEYSIKTYDTIDDSEVGSATYTNVANPTVAENGSVTNGVTTRVTSIRPLEITNSKSQSLPFTGGEGRSMIYVGSVALAGVVICLVIYKKRHREN